MRSFMKWALVLIVPAVFAATARPEEPAIPEGATVKLLLLRQKSVQKELGLTAETTQKIMEFTNAEAEAAGKALGQSGDARKQAFEQLATKNEEFLTSNLTAQQNKRLDQITMQFAALTHLTKPEMAKELNLTDEQVQKFKEMQTQARKALADLLEDKDRAAKTAKLAKLRAAAREKILALLTEEQKAKVREMVGESFEGEIVFEEDDK
jgi:Spy/CpxP family protein refolding chaperone